MYIQHNHLKVKLLFVITILMLNACAVINEVERPGLTRIDKINYKQLNGQYQNMPPDSATIRNKLGSQLWLHLAGRSKSSIPRTGENLVKISFQSDKKAICQVYNEGKLIREKTIRGKIKHDYFYQRPFFLAIPTFPLSFGYVTRGFRIGLEDDQLVLDYKENYWIVSIFGKAIHKNQQSFVYDRK